MTNISPAEEHSAVLFVQPAEVLGHPVLLAAGQEQLPFAKAF